MPSTPQDHRSLGTGRWLRHVLEKTRSKLLFGPRVYFLKSLNPRVHSSGVTSPNTFSKDSTENSIYTFCPSASLEREFPESRLRTQRAASSESRPGPRGKGRISFARPRETIFWLWGHVKMPFRILPQLDPFRQLGERDHQQKFWLQLYITTSTET